MKKPLSSEYPPIRYFANYIEQVVGEEVIETLLEQSETLKNFYKNLSEEAALYRYAPGKWSLKELLGHLTDAERIFAYRALCIARGETQSLPGFEENAYVEKADFDHQPLESLWLQYETTRAATLALARSLPEEAQVRIGTANGHSVSARAVFAIIAGHEAHHLAILKERYQKH
ncbi:DinB family protein [Tellurirhabdus rosea]|uniref:DinB family protein n=1 Tax=Tellurirhabdus rosea TaxID=2674997 RepID=UPI00225A9C38|nr:DinB family protein [Tellurirhabdus rosea]